MSMRTRILALRYRYRLWWPVLAGFVFICGVVVAGVAGFMLVEGWAFVDSLYMVVITLSTVGFTEVHPLSSEGRLFTVGLILSGVGAFAYLVGSFTQLMVEGRLQLMLERRRMQKIINKQSGHFIVCGYGRIGSIVAKEIHREGYPVVVVEKDPTLIEELEASGMMSVAGDATSDEVLLSAGLEKASSLITALTSDAANVYVTLTARQLNPKLTIIARADSEAHIPRLERAGADRVVLPNLIGGRRMAQSVLRPTVTNLLEIAARSNLDLQMEELRIGPDSVLNGKDLKSAGIRPRLNIIIMAIKKHTNEMIFNPGPDAVIESGDTLVTVGKPDHLQKLRDICDGQTAAVSV
ncbi:K+ transport system, NAD-binding component [Desulfocurvibacter africanus PCS]|uniref:K+ transport system, NAD-binding component n=1 Tax=Desulfocurvibacter africanus PCS TaxID=1262666 RepID=M5PXA0_DESAF|nr:potassium channel protein [Desulfocurvibacter africanus]EMG38942.1 K+ transport system, NAD-binding component [Desulfocurvibacter africanus PCS]